MRQIWEDTKVLTGYENISKEEVKKWLSEEQLSVEQIVAWVNHHCTLDGYVPVDSEVFDAGIFEIEQTYLDEQTMKDVDGTKDQSQEKETTSTTKRCCIIFQKLEDIKRVIRIFI